MRWIDFFSIANIINVAICFSVSNDSWILLNLLLVDILLLLFKSSILSNIVLLLLIIPIPVPVNFEFMFLASSLENLLSTLFIEKLRLLIILSSSNSLIKPNSSLLPFNEKIIALLLLLFSKL